MLKLWTIFIIMFVLVSCTTHISRKNTVSFFTSVPEGATLYSTNGENLGNTPLDKSAFRKICNTNRTFIVEKIGFMSVNYNANCDQDPDVVVLAELSSDQFKNQTFGTYYREINEFATKLLELHYLVLNNDTELARTGLQKFKESYPNVVASYTMLAQLELQLGNLDTARAYLKAALRIDPKNSYSLELLATLESSNEKVLKVLNTKGNTDEATKKMEKIKK